MKMFKDVLLFLSGQVDYQTIRKYEKERETLLGQGRKPISLVYILDTNQYQVCFFLREINIKLMNHVNELKFICQVHDLYYGHK